MPEIRTITPPDGITYDIAGGSGSTVSVTPTLTSGTQIGTITVDGTDTDLYAPTPPTVPSPSTSAPLMDGTASPGSGTEYARSNHVHPTDTSRQEALVSGTNIKTINSQSILGSGDISISTPTASTSTPLMDGTASYGSGTTYARGDHRHPTDTSRQETLVSGTNIKTINNASLLGSGDISVATQTDITNITGDLSNLNTRLNDSLVSAINCNLTDIGDITNLSADSNSDLVSAINAAYGFAAWGLQQTATKALYHCTGTLNGNIYYRVRHDGKAVHMFGRVYINNFARTGANPGITTDIIGTKSAVMVGFRGESPIEMVSFDPTTGRITTSETFSNASGTRLTLMVPPIIVFTK